MLKLPHHLDGPWFSGPPRNPLIPPALCALDSFMSPPPVWEIGAGDDGGEVLLEKKILICLLL